MEVSANRFNLTAHGPAMQGQSQKAHARFNMTAGDSIHFGEDAKDQPATPPENTTPPAAEDKKETYPPTVEGLKNFLKAQKLITDVNASADDVVNALVKEIETNHADWITDELKTKANGDTKALLVATIQAKDSTLLTNVEEAKAADKIVEAAVKALEKAGILKAEKSQGGGFTAGLSNAKWQLGVAALAFLASPFTAAFPVAFPILIAIGAIALIWGGINFNKGRKGEAQPENPDQAQPPKTEETK